MTKIIRELTTRRTSVIALEFFVIVVMPFFLGMQVLGLWGWDLTVPLSYIGSDDVWQLVLTKMLKDTGWILENPFLGAPDIAHWQYHSAGQTSSLHSILMRGLSYFVDDAVKIQQVYYLLNFSLISLTSYVACRMLGLARFAAGCIALLFAFTNFRLGWLLYAFLANYAAVPLAFVPVFWVITGEYAHYFPAAQPAIAGLKRLLRSFKFWIGLVFLLLVTLSDGYYAFFTLLMLAFGVFVRAVLGDLRRPVRLLAPLVFIGAIIVLALLMAAPLKTYQRTHVSEFFPDGKEDSTLVKHPMEAEVYSSSLKLLIAPITTHNVLAMADLGKTMVESNDAARKFPVIRPTVSLGSIASVLLLLVLAMLPALLLRRVEPAPARPSKAPLAADPIVWAAVGLSYFIFLCSISGGLGTLVALFYPTIRAYDRFALFLMFALLVGAGAAVTSLTRGAGKVGLSVAFALAAALTAAGLYDQIPVDTSKRDGVLAAKFLAERKFVQQVERALPRGAMLYQYPHSQYMSNSKYYGWGSFAQMRLYLHSQHLRWSNGGSKNSGVEKWHDSLAALPLDQLIDEVEAAGFDGIVVDRAVIPVPEYQAVKAALAARGMLLAEDGPSGLAFTKVADPGFRVVYDRDFANVERLLVSDRAVMGAAKLPRMVNALALNQLLEKDIGRPALAVERKRNPEVFISALQVDRGMGEKPILPLTDMAGALRCEMATRVPNGTQDDTLILSITNQSGFAWRFDRGPLPLKIGVHVRGADGAMLRWDDGYRVPTDAYIANNASAEVRVPLHAISRAGVAPHAQNVVVEFGLVQDGHAWFNQLVCSVALPH